jgi:ribonucleoside-diphosphate reductase alpha chain
MVESILIEEGLAETAKAYILYRHERRKLREMKMKILNKKDLDEVDKTLDVNSLRVLSSRYLLRDNSGEIIEGPKQLFERVAILVAISDIIHDSRVYDFHDNHTQTSSEAELYYKKLDDFDSKLKIGSYYFNKYHFDIVEPFSGNVSYEIMHINHFENHLNHLVDSLTFWGVRNDEEQKNLIMFF